MITSIVKSNFAKWANSFSGCDGGNIKGPVWFCGIEYGGNEINIENNNFQHESEPKYWPDDKRDEWFKYQFNRKILKLYSALLGENVDKYKEVARNRKAFDKDSDLFKMNLYPLAFKDTGDDHWKEAFYNATGIPTKEIYRAWCQIYRFKTIQSWSKQHSETLKLIICTGLSYARDFIMAFRGMKHVHNNLNETMVSKRYMKWILFNNEKTLLVIIPFLGHKKYDLNSNELLQEFGTEINKLCANQFGANWISKNT